MSTPHPAAKRGRIFNVSITQVQMPAKSSAPVADQAMAEKDQLIERLQLQVAEYRELIDQEPDEHELRKLYAQNATVLYVTYVKESDKHGGIDVCAKLSCNVSTKDGAGNWTKKGKWVEVTSTWFAAWNEEKAGNYVADELLETYKTNGAFRAKFFWQWNSNEDNVKQGSYIDRKTGEEMPKDEFINTPGKKVFAFEVLTSQKKDDLDKIPF